YDLAPAHLEHLRVPREPLGFRRPARLAPVEHRQGEGRRIARIRYACPGGGVAELRKARELAPPTLGDRPGELRSEVAEERERLARAPLLPHEQQRRRRRQQEHRR